MSVEEMFVSVKEASADFRDLALDGDSQDASMCVVVLIAETKKMLDFVAENQRYSWINQVYDPLITQKFRSLVEQAKALDEGTAATLVAAIDDMTLLTAQFMEAIRNPDDGPPDYKEAMKKGGHIVELLRNHMITSVQDRGLVEKNVMEIVNALKDLLGHWFKSKALKTLLAHNKDEFLGLLGGLAKLSTKLDANTKQETMLEDKGPAAEKLLQEAQAANLPDFTEFFDIVIKLADTLEKWLGNRYGQVLDPSPSTLHALKSVCMSAAQGEDVPLSAFGEKRAVRSGPIFEDTPARMQDYRDAFDTFRGEDEGVKIEMLGTMLRCFGLNPTEGELKKHAPGSADMSFDDFIGHLKTAEATYTSVTVESILGGFIAYDRLDNGFITGEQLRQILADPVGEALSEAQAGEIFSQLSITDNPETEINYLIEIASSFVYSHNL